MHASPGPTIEEQTVTVLRRIQEVEQEIATLREKRARHGERDERVRIAALERRIAEAEKELLAVTAARRRVRRPMSAIASARLGFYAFGGVLIAGGLFAVGAAWYQHAEPSLLAVAAAPLLGGVLMVLRTYRARTVSDVLGGDLDG